MAQAAQALEEVALHQLGRGTRLDLPPRTRCSQRIGTPGGSHKYFVQRTARMLAVERSRRTQALYDTATGPKLSRCSSVQAL